MSLLFYVRLIGLTAGTLVYLFLLALIVGHRRPRRFERVLFLLLLSLFLIYAGGLLAVNSQLHYTSPPEATRLFFNSMIALGIMFLVPLVAQTHVDYLRQVRSALITGSALVLSYSLYLIPATCLAVAATAAHRHPDLGVVAFLDSLVGQTGLIVLVSAIVAAPLQLGIAQSAKDPTERSLFFGLFGVSLLLALSPILGRAISALLFSSPENLLSAVVVLGVLPGAVLIYFALRRNFLDFGAQRNLVYALSATFLVLLYLALVRRVSGWLEPILPPEATASVLLFVLIFLFEPLERVIGPALHRTLRERMDLWQRLTVDLQQNARHGDLARLVSHAEGRIFAEFSLAAVRISVPRDLAQKPLESPGGLGHVVQIPLLRDCKEIGMLEAASTGSYLTGETTAALEFLAEQLPAMLDLCRLIEEKLALERELAERERLALLGQMAASLSHNLRNPLSSIKTVLQVQLERPDLPADLRHDCSLVLAEIDRMNVKLSQLLHFAKPSPDGRRVAALALAKQTAELFRHDAERRNVILEFDAPDADASALISEEALGEILSNLVVNAIESQPNGGRVLIAVARHADRLEIRIEDNGPGIGPELRSKIFQPFYTTKASGTGLGLSIVARRVTEIGGTLACESPITAGKGTRFRLSLPLAPGEEF